MTDITPPPELAAQWVAEIYGDPVIPLHPITLRLVERAAQWGADQELEACCEWMSNRTVVCPSELRAARRPKPKSLKEQALQELDKVDMLWDTEKFGKDTLNSLDTIRKALEALPDD